MKKKSTSSSVNLQYRAFIRKEALKFSAAHMTVFPDGKKEALHGHNYRPELVIELSGVSLEGMVPFADFKKVMKEISRDWDEQVLIAERCPFLKVVSRSKREVELLLCGKRYVFPSDETVFLDVDNITTETLAGEYVRRLVKGLEKLLSRAGSPVQALEVRIDEMTGQGASARWCRA